MSILKYLLCVLSVCCFAQGVSAALSQEITYGSQTWKLVGTTSSAEFADAIYQLVSEDGASEGFAEQILRLAISKDRNTLVDMEEQLLASFSPDSISRQDLVMGPEFYVRRAQVRAASADVPEFVVLTALEEKSHPEFFAAIQYSIKPHCKNCMQTVNNWKNLLKNDDLKSAFKLSDLQFKSSLDERGFFTRVYDDYSPYIVSFTITAGSVAFLGGKLILGAMGFNGPCGQNMATGCRCGQM